MASGCTSNSSSFSSDCLQPISDQCVKYTGPAIPGLGVCTGDMLNEVEAVILNQILAFSQGMGIMISGIDLTACSLFTTYVTCCNGPGTVSKQLSDLIKIIFDALCALDTRLTLVETFINGLINGPFTISCLSGVTSSSSFLQILQALFTKVCQLDAALTALTTIVNNLSTGLPTTIGNFLLAHINSCQTGSLVKSGSGSTANIQLMGFSPIGTIMAFDGDISMFDGTGLGRTNTSACGWALCNGNNGTQNMGGLMIMGATTMLTTPPAAADGGTYAHGAVGGKVAVTLTAAQVPSVGFSGATSTGTGSLGFYTVSRKHASTGDNTMGYMCDGGGTSTPCPSAPNSTINFTIPGQSFSGSTGGGGGSHQNLPPYIALEWIKRIS